MKLNIDCVRDILLAIEEKPLGEPTNVSKLHERLLDYSEEDIHYTCLKLSEAGFIELVSFNVLRQNFPAIKSIMELTFQGHEFLEKIRDDSVWTETKKKAPA